MEVSLDARAERLVESADDVIRTIEEAFRGVPLGTLTLHEAELLDRYSSTDAERSAARKLDPERDWRAVPDASIQECGDALSFLDTTSWRFYLPAFMRCGLRHITDMDNSALGNAVFTLDPAGIRQHERRQEERFQILDATQVRAVCAFLRFASLNGDPDDTSAREALDDYWDERGGV
jgi:hypothetical protein